MALASHVPLLLFNEKNVIWEKVGSFQSNNKIKNLPKLDFDRNSTQNKFMPVQMDVKSY